MERIRTIGLSPEDRALGLYEEEKTRADRAEAALAVALAALREIESANVSGIVYDALAKIEEVRRG